MYAEFRKFNKEDVILLALSYNNKGSGGVNIDLKPLFTNTEDFPKIKNESLISNSTIKNAHISKIKED